MLGLGSFGFAIPRLREIFLCPSNCWKMQPALALAQSANYTSHGRLLDIEIYQLSSL
jgi:hypothetical protein